MEREKRSFLIDVLWPKHTLHVVSGSSGTWKTAMTFSIIREWEQGNRIWDMYDSHPCDWQYIAFDRSLNETWDTLDTIHYSPNEKRIHSAYGSRSISFDKAGLIKTMKLLPHGGLLIVDGLQFISPSRNDQGQFQSIGEFVRGLRVAAQSMDITILGVCHNAKARKGEEYSHPRDRIMGTVAWGATTGTLLALENTHDGDGTKTLWVCPRTASEYKCIVSRDKQGYIHVKTVEQAKGEMDSQARNELLRKLNKVSPGTLIKTGEMTLWSLDLGRSEKTVDRFVKWCVETGKLIREGKGCYRVPHEQ